MNTTEALALYNKARGSAVKEQDLPYLPDISLCLNSIIRVSDLYFRMSGNHNLSRQVVCSLITMHETFKPSML